MWAMDEGDWLAERFEAHRTHPVGRRKVTSAMRGTGILRADSRAICARRQVTTEPELRRRIRNSRLPSSPVISRTPARSATPPPCCN